MQKKYTINYLHTYQCGPDDWETYIISIELEDETTILDIKERIASETRTTVDRIDLRGMKIGILSKKEF